jgi:hypothetical protein
MIVLFPLLAPLILAAQMETRQAAQYETVFREYLSLTSSAAAAKDAGKLLPITDSFEREHRQLRLAFVIIWNRDLGTQNNLLFSREYVKATLSSLAKIHYADESKINVSLEPDHTLIDYRPRESKISYRLVFLR